VRPSFVSQETSFAVLGIVPRKFLEIIAPRCKRVSRVGKTVLVELEEAERVVCSLSVDLNGETATDELPAAGPRNDDGQPTTAAEVLRRLGMELVP
jgi:hypothetical protein